jgi:MFS superfamily sulfate permease-like transporter
MKLTTLRQDIPAGLVVFFVALPLCLGIAQATGAPLLAGLLSGVIGGLVVSAMSGSHLSVSGPALAGITVVAAGIREFGFPTVLAAVVLAGLMQIVLGTMRLGRLAHFVPSSVVKGMLAAVGLVMVFKQIPHAVGWDHDFEGDDAFLEQDGTNTFSDLLDSLERTTPAAVIVAMVGIVVWLVWHQLQKRASQSLRLIPAPLVVVVVGIVTAMLLNRLFAADTNFNLGAEHWVHLPEFSSLDDAFHFPNFSRLNDVAVWKLAAAIALFASLESLLSLEAIDRLDPSTHMSPPNRELLAQGVGNIAAGLVGGLPVASLVVRSSANVQAGAKSRASSVVHGLLLMVGVLWLSSVLNLIPLASLAVVLIGVGLRLLDVQQWRALWKAGAAQFVPFVVTIVGVLFLDVLRGTLLGVLVGVVFALRATQQNAIVITKDNQNHLLRFAKVPSFLHKAALKEALASIPDHASLLVDTTRVGQLDPDIREIIDDFGRDAAARNITIKLKLTGGYG